MVLIGKAGYFRVTEKPDMSGFDPFGTEDIPSLQFGGFFNWTLLPPAGKIQIWRAQMQMFFLTRQPPNEIRVHFYGYSNPKTELIGCVVALAHFSDDFLKEDHPIGTLIGTAIELDLSEIIDQADDALVDSIDLANIKL